MKNFGDPESIRRDARGTKSGGEKRGKKNVLVKKGGTHHSDKETRGRKRSGEKKRPSPLPQKGGEATPDVERGSTKERPRKTHIGRG